MYEVLTEALGIKTQTKPLLATVMLYLLPHTGWRYNRSVTIHVYTVVINTYGIQYVKCYATNW